MHPMRNRWREIWSGARAAAAAPLRGIGLMLLSVVCFILALWVIMVAVRVIAG